MGEWETHLRGLARQAADFVLPPLCALCRTPVTGHHAVCGRCWGQLHFLTPPWCESCGVPFAVTELEAKLCAVCLTTPPVYGRSRAALAYDEGARALISRFKYGDQLHLLPLLAPWLAKAGAEVLNEADVLVPVPLHWKRLLWRRYNQAALLAQAVASCAKLPVDLHALGRVRATTPQVGQPRATRLGNVRHAFAVMKPEQVAGKVVVLVDDVLTTGATLSACAEVLHKSGVKEVRTLTFARVAHPAHIGDEHA